MNVFRRQISLLLALVIIFTSAINGVVVACTSGSDHHAIELIGHHTELLDHSVDPTVFTEQSHDHEAHPKSCVDSFLLADTIIQQNSSSLDWEERAHQVFLVYPIDELIKPVITYAPQSWSIPLNISSLRPATDDLSTIRILI